MSRRHAAVKRKINPDAKYGDLIIAKFMNCLMERGKKSTAEKIVYGALELAEKKLKQSAVEVFKSAVKATRPTVEVRSRRVGGATYQVPVEVKEDRSIALSIRWLISSSRKRPEKTMITRLAGEFMDAINNRGGAVKKKEEAHKMAEANKAFSHYRW